MTIPHHTINQMMEATRAEIESNLLDSSVNVKQVKIERCDLCMGDGISIVSVNYCVEMPALAVRGSLSHSCKETD